MAKETKRVNKTKEELAMEIERQEAIKFWEEIKKVEDKFGMKVRAYVQKVEDLRFAGYKPFLSAEKVEKVEIGEEEKKEDTK